MAADTLTAADLADALRAFGLVLAEHRSSINRLNVYPVPDGDTGTNMHLTVAAVTTELDAITAGAVSMEAVCAAMSHGSLMGARGNSGVILSQLLRGLAEAWSDVPGQIGAPELAQGLRKASDGAYSAVSNPVEGTILSVARAAAEGAERASASSRLLGTLEAARASAATALAATTEQLPALRSAGVVDAGGAGFLLLLDSLLHAADGRQLPSPPAGAAGDEMPIAHAVSQGLEPEDALRYEVMFLLEAPDETVPAFKAVWAGCGGSIVIVGGDGLYNCHIHTDDVGAAIEAAIEIGRPRQVRVTDLRDQVQEERWVREATATPVPEPPAEPCTCAVVAVCAGEGVKRIFRSLGASVTVWGGQSANPSTAQVLEAVETAPAQEVVVLPNNPNVVAVAEQAAANSTKKVRVVPTPGVPEGFAALLEYDPQADAATNADHMAAAASRVVAGEVAQASRTAQTPAGPVAPGDWLGLCRRGIRVVSPASDGPSGAAVGLLGLLVEEQHEIVTIIEGEGAHPAQTRRIVEWLADNRPLASAEVHHGGQPLYPYLFSIE